MSNTASVSNQQVVLDGTRLAITELKKRGIELQEKKDGRRKFLQALDLREKRTIKIRVKTKTQR